MKLWLPITAGLFLSAGEVLACDACAARALLGCSPISLVLKLFVAVMVVSGRLKPVQALTAFSVYLALGFLGWMLTNNNLHLPLPLPNAIFQFAWQFGVLDIMVLVGIGQIACFRCDPAKGIGFLRVVIGLLAGFGLRVGFGWVI